MFVNFVSTQFLLLRNFDFSYIYEKEVSQSDWLDMPWICPWFISSCASTMWKVGEPLPFSLLKMHCMLGIWGKAMNFGEQKVLSNIKILTAHSIHMKNSKSTQRWFWNVQKWSAFSAKEVRIFRFSWSGWKHRCRGIVKIHLWRSTGQRSRHKPNVIQWIWWYKHHEWRD